MSLGPSALQQTLYTAELTAHELACGSVLTAFAAVSRRPAMVKDTTPPDKDKAGITAGH